MHESESDTEPEPGEARGGDAPATSCAASAAKCTAGDSSGDGVRPGHAGATASIVHTLCPTDQVNTDSDRRRRRP